jgi:hypothetical protein
LNRTDRCEIWYKATYESSTSSGRRVEQKLPPTVGAFQTLEYPFPPQEVHPKEANLGAIILCQAWAVIASLFECGFVLGCGCFRWHFMRPWLFLILAVYRVENVNAPKTFRTLNNKRPNVRTVDHYLREFTVGRNWKLSVLVGQCEEVNSTVVLYVLWVPGIKGHIVVDERVLSSLGKW